MLGNRIVGKGITVSIMFFMIAATAMMPCAVGESTELVVTRHPPGAPSTDEVHVEWTPLSDGEMYLSIKNAGLASVTIQIVDITASETLLTETVRFQGDKTAERNSRTVSVVGGNLLRIYGTPGGAPYNHATLTVEYTPSSTAEVVYTISDMFEEPWGDWWDYRVGSSTWDTERLLTSDAGDVTYLYSTSHNPSGTTSDQGLIYAPYRWAVDAVNIPSMDVHNPVLMPKVGSIAEGAAVSMDVHFQYLYQEGGEWTEDWVPMWNTHDLPDFASVDEVSTDPETWTDDVETTHLAYNDGYMTGTLIQVTMNRAAAEEWLGMPQSAEALDWWASEGGDYLADWETWIDSQGNDVFDIYCGYEWEYYVLGTAMKLSLDSSYVVLEIGHVSWGYEALITRWLEHTGISKHQPYMEDFTMTVDYREDDVDLTYDAVAQWSLHCVMQTGETPGEYTPCAWVWEPIALDYIVSWPAHPDSDYDPYASLTYPSWNVGDVQFGTDVSYEGTPVEMDLVAGRTLVVELPTDVVTGYYAVSVPEDAISEVWDGNTGDYDAIRYDGYMSFGYLDLDGNAYDTTDNVLTIEGPADFTNVHPDDDDCLLHGAPWLEFNVDPIV